MQPPEQARRIAESLVQRGITAGATAADALYVADRSSAVQVRLGELEDVSRSEGQQIGLRLFDGQRSATVASSDMSDEALGVLVERCLAMAREAPEDPFAGLAPEQILQLGDMPSIDGLDPRDVLRAAVLVHHPLQQGERAALLGSDGRGHALLGWSESGGGRTREERGCSQE